MGTLLSHIVQRRLAGEAENVATEALTYILGASWAARSAMVELLRRFVPDLPELEFRGQVTAGAARPDMVGLDERGPRVMIENKFWAGFTDNQPVEYLRSFERPDRTNLVLVVVPSERCDGLVRPNGTP